VKDDVYPVIEDYSSLCGSPFGSLLKQRSLALLDSNLPPPEVLILSGTNAKKPDRKVRLFKFGR